MGIAINVNVTKREFKRSERQRRLLFFKPVGFRKQFATLFEEWRATGRQGRPSRFLHPIKWYYWGKWNALTNLPVGDLKVMESVRMGPAGAHSSRAIDAILGERKPATAKQMKKLTEDAALFL